MRVLFIHADNVPVSVHDAVKSCGHIETFRITQSDLLEHSYSFDRHADRWLRGRLSGHSYDLIVLPYTLSGTDYLELTGLRLGVHIRLTPELAHHRVPILYVGSETPDQIAKLSDLGNFLFTSGVYTTTDFNVDGIRSRLHSLAEGTRKLSEEQYQRLVDRLQVNPAANYDSHHALDNDLALVSWSEHIGCAHAIAEVQHNLSTGLYFKLNRIRNRNTENEQGTPRWKAPELSNGGKVVLIDDEAVKGWATFYKELLKSSGVEVEHFPGPFKHSEKIAMIDGAVEFVKKQNADVVLLDLRLHDDDFTEGIAPRDLSGVKVLEGIKEWNGGVRVIVTTASNKIRSFKEVMDSSDDYFIKDGNGDVNETCNLVVSAIDRALGNAKRLKSWDDIFQRTLQNAGCCDDLSLDFKSELHGSYETSFRLLEDALKRQELRGPTYVHVFQIIEKFLKEKGIVKRDGHRVWVNGDTMILTPCPTDHNECKSAMKLIQGLNTYAIVKGGGLLVKAKEVRIDTNFRMSAVLIFRFGFGSSSEKDWPKIRDKRNACAHEGQEASDQELNKLMTFLGFLFDPKNLNLRAKIDGIDEDELEKARLAAMVAKLSTKP